METEEVIPAGEFCMHHNIELSFLYSLQESGLIEITTIDEKTFLPINQLSHLEKLVRLYYEMDINLEGIETITYLLQRLGDMQRKLTALSSRLNEYETD